MISRVRTHFAVLFTTAVLLAQTGIFQKALAYPWPPGSWIASCIRYSVSQGGQSLQAQCRDGYGNYSAYYTTLNNPYKCGFIENIQSQLQCTGSYLDGISTGLYFTTGIIRTRLGGRGKKYLLVWRPSGTNYTWCDVTNEQVLRDLKQKFSVISGGPYTATQLEANGATYWSRPCSSDANP